MINLLCISGQVSVRVLKAVKKEEKDPQSRISCTEVRGDKGNKAHEKERERPCEQTAPHVSAGPTPRTSPSLAYRST